MLVSSQAHYSTCIAGPGVWLTLTIKAAETGISAARTAELGLGAAGGLASFLAGLAARTLSHLRQS